MGEGELPADLTDTHPALHALRCILGLAAVRATKDKTLPGDALQLVADVLAARGGETTVAAALGAHLPLLHHHAPAFTAPTPTCTPSSPAHPHRPPRGWPTGQLSIRRCSPHWTAPSCWPHYAINPAAVRRSASGTRCSLATTTCSATP
ncbi:hypothetical protein OG939_36115 [Streptomyces sp. NBC_01685]|uniref:hypothetical protein n=1 Tax=Streptomyces sp. NBC_01685 TaxID=2975910 RepID=UPI002E335ECF|nr:hypothetical protein [Streptomyces sp. NBC_01685]